MALPLSRSSASGCQLCRRQKLSNWWCPCPRQRPPRPKRFPCRLQPRTLRQQWRRPRFQRQQRTPQQLPRLLGGPREAPELRCGLRRRTRPPEPRPFAIGFGRARRLLPQPSLRLPRHARRQQLSRSRQQSKHLRWLSQMLWTREVALAALLRERLCAIGSRRQKASIGQGK